MQYPQITNILDVCVNEDGGQEFILQLMMRYLTYRGAPRKVQRGGFW